MRADSANVRVDGFAVGTPRGGYVLSEIRISRQQLGATFEIQKCDLIRVWIFAPFCGLLGHFWALRSDPTFDEDREISSQLPPFAQFSAHAAVAVRFPLGPLFS
jgi:hypothetical protein